MSGTGQALIEPFLDNMVAYKNTDQKPTIDRTCEETLELIKGERGEEGRERGRREQEREG